MKPHACCGIDTRSAESKPAVLIRARRFGAWIVPGAILALLPKCPACLAAYLVLISGVGVSVAAAAQLRVVLIFSSVAALGYLAVSVIKRVVAQ
jgi:hypothetical protein